MKKFLIGSILVLVLTFSFGFVGSAEAGAPTFIHITSSRPILTSSHIIAPKRTTRAWTIIQPKGITIRIRESGEQRMYIKL